MQNYVDKTAPYTALVIIGGGPAGMAAAVAAYDDGVRDMVILERDLNAGGILRQCIHNGFGLHRFGEELTGPEYADRYHKMVVERGIAVKTGATVLDVTPSEEEGIAAYVTAISEAEGMFTLRAGAVVLAMGCRERSKGALNIAGTRPAGIYSAGTAQRFVNMEGYMPGRKVVILGSGDIGLIMARRMTLEGAEVKAVCELMPYSGGLARNITQCLDDFGIPLMLSHTVTQIHGKERLTGVTVSKVDEKRRPIPGSEIYFECDTLLLSVGLIPENELTRGANIGMDGITGGATVDQYRQTSLKGVFACGNVLHVHDLVDYVSEEAALAGTSAAAHLRGELTEGRTITLKTDGKVRYTVPQTVTITENTADVTVYFRPSDIYRDVTVTVREVRTDGAADGNIISKKKRIKVAPGEMETITIKAADLTAATADTLLVSIEESAKKGGNA
ncbi:MAG: FAD-dependent oxidoreductase [Clostridia bacterium]|nr:FAD-dependent oxidoreductase [Clostridia bacterium]